jgi:hypothetical protein
MDNSFGSLAIMRKENRTKKQILKELRKEYTFRCKLRYFVLLGAYFCDFSVKIYLLYMVAGIYIAYVGALIDFMAKWAHLRETKFRKKGFYERR